MQSEKTIQQKSDYSGEKQLSISHFDLFESYSYIDECNLFTAHFNYIPNVIKVESVNCKKAIKWFEQKYGSEIKNHYFKKEVNASKIRISNAFYILKKVFMFCFINIIKLGFSFEKPTIKK